MNDRTKMIALMAGIKISGDVEGLWEHVAKCQNTTDQDGTVDADLWVKARSLAGKVRDLAKELDKAE